MQGMLGLHIHPGGRIYIRGSTETWSGTPAEFFEDFGIAPPELPEGAIELIHDPRGRTIKTIESGEASRVDPLPAWDAAIAKLSEAVAAKEAREAPPPPKVRTLAEVAAAAVLQIDGRAEAARAKWITLGGGQALTYEAKRREAEAWAGDSAPDPAKYPWARARAARLNSVAPSKVTKAQTQPVIDEWLAAAAAWAAAGIAIEDVREATKEAIASAGDVTAIDAIMAGVVWPEPA